MKKEIVSFLTFLANVIAILCFAFVSFLLLINVYHYRDVSMNSYVDVKNNGDYKEYLDILKNVDRKMEKVNNIALYDNESKVIYSNYQNCKNVLDKAYFSTLSNTTYITEMDIYKLNDEFLNDLSNKCLFNVAYNINTDNKKFNNDFSNIYKEIEYKTAIAENSAEYLVKSSFDNSSYSFTTDAFRMTVYDKAANEFNLTVNNYKTLAFVLEQIADFYEAEFGGNA